MHPAGPLCRAAQVWNGPLITFTLASGANPNLPTNQDRLTPNVWITRGAFQGIYNAAAETSYTHNFSPANTEWAYGSLANYASLTYTDWETWNIGNPPSTVGQPAVMHLISDDIYLSVTFTSWGQMGAGGFSYQRSTPAPSPSPPRLGGVTQPDPGGFRFAFTNAPGLTFSVLAATNAALPLTGWTVRGVVTDAPPGSGSYQFTDPGVTTNAPRMFYRVRWP